MAYTRKPLYVFKDENEKGVDKIPLNRVILNDAIRILYVKIKQQGLTDQTTLKQAIASKNVVLLMADIYNEIDSVNESYEFIATQDQQDFKIQDKHAQTVRVYREGILLRKSEFSVIIQGADTIIRLLKKSNKSDFISIFITNKH